MAKAKLGTLTERWIDGKAEKRLAVKTEDAPKYGYKKIKQTLYLPENVVKLLWHNRAETGETISRTVERLVKKNLEKK